MRDYDSVSENRFFEQFKDYYDLEKSVSAQHNPANYTLERMTPLADVFEHPERKLKVIHVAGTKGKGSTCHFISALIQASGHSVGLFTSPHLSTVRERFQLNNALVPYDTLIAAAQDAVARLKAHNLKPSLFEIFTVMALKMFVDNGMEYAVVETGIGGLLDATNYIPNVECCAIAPVSIDHVALLGYTIESIAQQKAGIIKEGTPVVVSLQPYAAAEDIIVKQAEKCHAPVIRPLSQEDCAPFIQPQWAPFLKENFTTAMAVVKQLGLTPDASAFVMPQLRARCEVICQDPLVIIDAAHNADSMAHLVTALKTLYPDVRFTVILAAVEGKDIRGMVNELAKLDAEVMLTNPRTTRPSALEDLKEFSSQKLRIVGYYKELTSRKQLPKGKSFLFTGSFFTALIGENLFN